MSRTSIAVIGDLHGSWTAEDVRYFNASDYELLLFTGDLGSGTEKNGVDIARSVARLKKPALVVAGNNDAPFAARIEAEFRYERGLAQLMKLAPSASGLGRAGNVRLGGYEARTVLLAGRQVTVVVGRPYATGGNEWPFADVMREKHRVTGPAQSVTRLRQLIDATPTTDLLILAHNGPSGLGHRATDIWGCDFRAEQGDWGDDDLRIAIEHAKRRGKRVLAVIAGHMHRGRSNPDRTAILRQDGITYVNAAYVPRVFATSDGANRHHMALHLDDVGGCRRYSRSW